MTNRLWVGAIAGIPLVCVIAGLPMSSVGRAQVIAESTLPDVSPGAAPSVDRLIGTWTVTVVEGGPAERRREHAESTTYRFQEAGRVTVAGSKQCAYAFDGAELKVDCDGRPTTGMLRFRGDRSMQWRIGEGQTITLIKR